MIEDPPGRAAGPATLASPDRLLALYYQDVRQIAHRILQRDAAVHLLQPTELAHEAAMRLMKLERMDFRSVPHFLATAARVMRQALLDEVRRALAKKRQNQALLTAWPDADPADAGLDLEGLDAALRRLEGISPERARVVELRFFGGLSFEEVAEVQGVSVSTVKRQWQVARIWLMTELGGAGPAPDGEGGPPGTATG
jgi:RNA polymerase sigma factor (TIGR02999 family)